MKAIIVLVCLLQYVLSDCEVSLDSMSTKYPPLLLQNGNFILPDTEQRILKIEEGGNLDLYCHGNEKKADATLVKVTDVTPAVSVPLICMDGKFYAGETEVNVHKAKCAKKQEPRMIKTQEECSPIGADGRTQNLTDLYTVQLGWKLYDTFHEQIRLCIDESVYGTIWTAHNITSKIEFRDKSPGRPGFRIDTTRSKRFFQWTTSTKTNRYYSKRSQKKTVTKILGGVTKINDVPLIDSSRRGTNYFAKGHLAPDAAFFYDVFQDATYYFMNAAPQFQSFNNGNWKALEGSVRDFADKTMTDLAVYTGTYGILTFNDVNNNPQQIFLFEKYIPAPEYYWKVVHDPQTNTGAAFIGLNNPHVKEAPQELCENRCSEMEWVDWSITELDAGYMYCCSIEDAAKAIPSIPMIQTSGLLHMAKAP